MDEVPSDRERPDVVASWQAAAAEYGRLSARIGFYDAGAARLADMVPPRAEVVADFACGHGRLARALLRGPVRSGLRELILIDAAPAMVRATEDIAVPGIRIRRLVDDHDLSRLVPAHRGRIDAIGISSALHLIRDAAGRLALEPFLARCREALAPGGCILANVPDQVFDFGDGWTSRVHAHARRLRPDTPERAALERIGDDALRGIAGRCGFALSVVAHTLEVTWSDFIAFYRIPAIGEDRLGAGAWAGRLAEIEAGRPWFDREPYRWAFLRFERRASPGDPHAGGPG